MSLLLRFSCLFARPVTSPPHLCHKLTGIDTPSSKKAKCAFVSLSIQPGNLTLILVTILMLAPVSVAYAQVTYSGNGAAASNLINVDNVSIPAFPVPAGVGRLLVVAVDYANPATAVTSITYDGASMSHAVTADRGGVAFVDIWYLALGDGIAVTGDVHVILNGLTNNMRGGAASFQNVDQSDPIGTSQTLSGVFKTSSSLSLNMVLENGVFDAISVAGYPGNKPASGGPQTETFNILQANFLAGSFQVASSNSTLMGWSFPESTHFQHAAIEIKCNCNQPMEIHGTTGDDVLAGGNGDDVIHGDAGNDSLLGLGGNDTLYGDEGNDLLFGGEGDDLLDPGLNDNCLDGGSGFDIYEHQSQLAQISEMSVAVITTAHTTITSMARNIESLISSLDSTTAKVNSNTAVSIDLPDCEPLISPEPDTYTNTIYNVEKFIGTNFNDTFTGAGGSDIFDGSGGDDVMTGELGDDILIGGSGADTLTGGEGNDIIYGDDELGGGIGNDTLYGDEGNDLLFGGAGDDKLDGSIGDDILTGGAHDDILTGGEGNDTYILNMADLLGHDQASDKQGNDRLIFQDFGLEKVVSTSKGENGSLVLNFTDGGSLTIEKHFSSNSFRIERLEVDDCSYWISHDPGFESGTIQDLIGGCITFDDGFEGQ